MEANAELSTIESREEGRTYRDMLTRIQTGPSTSAPATALTGRVVARPGAIVDVFVPMTGRVAFTKELLPRVGAHVVAGQTLALLEQHYVTDESVHLINARWSILVEMLAAKRRMLEDTANAERSQFLYEHESVPLKTVQDDRAAAAVATSEYERWRDNLTKHIRIDYSKQKHLTYNNNI